MASLTPQLPELFYPGHMVTARAAVALTQGQFVTVTSGDDDDHATVKVATAGTRAFGLVSQDTEAGELVTIQRGLARCFRLPNAPALSAGQLIEVGTEGKPTAAADGEVVAQALRNTTDGHIDITLV